MEIYNNGLDYYSGKRLYVRQKTKLTESQVAQIKRKLLDGTKCIDLAAEFGVSTGAIREIKRERYWASIEPATEEETYREENEND